MEFQIYPVGRFLAMGFAGSVRIGFAMVDTLSAFFKRTIMADNLADKLTDTVDAVTGPIF